MKKRFLELLLTLCGAHTVRRQSSTGTRRSFKGIFLWAFRPELLLSNTPVSIVRSEINA